MYKGLFISVEGPDGSGKSTQIDLLKKYIEDRGRTVVFTREPGGTPIGEKIRTIILDPENTEMDYLTEAMLYAASRAQHVHEVIRPALKRGDVVICDRFVDSSIAYQGFGRELGQVVAIINSFAISECVPDVTLLFKLDPTVGISRIKREQDRLEMEDLEFHKRVYEGYLEVEKANPERVVGIDAGRDIEEIHKEIIDKIGKLL
ncbi:MAG: dTMP kinase [Firmicutes bacterium]|nr:dTMP kinase [Bacillota bacterium]